MDILVVIIALLVLLLASAWSSARSYFVKGRLAGMEEATLEIIRGVGHTGHTPSGLTLPVDSRHKTGTGEVAEWLKAALC